MEKLYLPFDKVWVWAIGAGLSFADDIKVGKVTAAMAFFFFDFEETWNPGSKILTESPCNPCE